jgi:xanthine dehydrogenase accessory factor
MLEHFEQTEDSLARLRGPIGIYIGSKTPAEIAVSVMAEILAVKNGVQLPRDMAVTHAKNARGMAANEDEQQALSGSGSAAVCAVPR